MPFLVSYTSIQLEVHTSLQIGGAQAQYDFDCEAPTTIIISCRDSYQPHPSVCWSSPRQCDHVLACVNEVN